MGRFYQTSGTRFLDDFIFQPNFELAAKVLEQKDKEAINKYKQIKFFEELPIDYWDIDDKNIQQELERFNPDLIAEDFFRNPDDSSVSKRLLEMQANFKDSWNNGNISKIVQNYNKHKEYQDILDSLSNEDKVIYKTIEDKYRDKVGEEGALKEIFDYGKIYPKIDILNGFLESNEFNKLAIKSHITQDDIKSGAWLKKIYEENKEVKPEDLKNAFKEYARNNLSDYMRTRQDVSTGTPFEEKYYDENGNILFEDPNSTIGKTYAMLDAYRKDSYKKTEDRRQNPFSVIAYRHRLNTSGGSGTSNPNLPVGVKDISAFYNTDFGRQQIARYNAQFADLLTSKLGIPASVVKTVPVSQLENTLLSKIEEWSNSKNPAMQQVAKDVYDRYYKLKRAFNDEMLAWEAQFRNLGYSDKELVTVSKKLKGKGERLLADSVGIFMGPGDVPLQKDDGKMIPYKDMLGTTVTIDGQSYKITKVEPNGDPVIAIGSLLDNNGQIDDLLVQPIKYELQSISNPDAEPIPYLGQAYMKDTWNVARYLRQNN